MVLCIVVGCGNRSGRDKGIYFTPVPAVVRNQGEEAEILSQERRSRWISAISRADLQMKFCTTIGYMEDILFLDKRPRPGIDIMLTGCLH